MKSLCLPVGLPVVPAGASKCVCPRQLSGWALQCICLGSHSGNQPHSLADRPPFPPMSHQNLSLQCATLPGSIPLLKNGSSLPKALPLVGDSKPVRRSPARDTSAITRDRILHPEGLEEPQAVEFGSWWQMGRILFMEEGQSEP